MSNSFTCSNCGSDAVVDLSDLGPRCEDCPPETCERCGDELDTESDEYWKWQTMCNPCKELQDMGVWCDSCEGQLVIDKWDYDGVRVSCDCFSIRVPHDAFTLNAPVPWKVMGSSGEKHMKKGLR